MKESAGKYKSKINLICFPKVSNRQEFNDHLEKPIDKESLKYVLTKEELDSNQWLEDLDLGSSRAPSEEYERLLAILISGLSTSWLLKCSEPRLVLDCLPYSETSQV